MRLSTKRITICAILAALALGLSYLENFLPLAFIPIPGIKLGLANIVTLFALLALGIPEAFCVLIIRVCLGSIFAGNVSAMLFSLFGGLLAMTIMALLSKSHCSVYGISIAGAAAHQCGQILAAMLVLKSVIPLGYLPILLVVSIVTGSLTGLVSAFLYQAVAKTKSFSME